MMKMSESRHYPVPKPRQSRKPFPGSKASPIVCPNSSAFSSSPPSKPPVIKPKPKGYKALDFNNKGLVSITKDIDIGDGLVNSSTIIVTNEHIEKNNNITSVKDACILGNVKGNSETNSFVKPKSVEALSKLYKRPLPPTPCDDSADTENGNIKKELCVSDAIASDSTIKASDNIVNQRTPPLPRKPPRLCVSASELLVHGKSTDPTGIPLDNTCISLTELRGNREQGTASKRNPTLPRKPTKLCRPSGFPKNTTPFSKSAYRPVTLPEQPAIETKGDINMSTPEMTSTNAPHSLGLSSHKNNWDKDIGRTPPLPRKLGQKLSPGLQMHCQLARSMNGVEEQSWDIGGSEQRPVQLQSDDKTISHVVSGSHDNKDGKRLTSVGLPPDDQTQRTSPRHPAAKPGVMSSMCENKFIYPTRTPSELSAKQDANNSCSIKQIPEGHGSNVQLDNMKKGGMQGLAGANTRREPPQKALPPIPLENKTHHGSSRRAPPGLPKQPSLEKKKSFPPPLPHSPRPTSVVANKGESAPHKMLRAKSAGDLVENDDSDYWVAYQHMKPAKDEIDSNQSEYVAPDNEVVQGFMNAVKRKSAPPRCSEETSKSNDGGYVTPDEDVVKEFVESIDRKTKQSSKDDESKEKLDPVKQATENNTYYSSTDDSDHEYVEPDDSALDKDDYVHPDLMSPISITSSHSYIEPIHREEPAEPSKSLNKKFEFKPFKDMDGEWSEPKTINWEYDGESEDSDVSYVEPDEDDDSFELGAEGEPLYQIYQANVLEKERTLSLSRRRKTSNSESSTFSEGVILRSNTLAGAKMLWCQLPEVRNSGLLDNIAEGHRKIQEAIYEVISSEASYLKSLNLLVDHYLKALSVDSFDSILDKNQFSELFLNIREIVKISESFLNDLRTRKRKSILMESISDIITEHATNHFSGYVTYCSCQYKQDRMLSQLKKNDFRFAEVLDKLERDSRVVGLTLQSFLVLPMQRVTRYPLLVDAIVRRCEPGSPEYYKTDEALKAVNQVVHKCNEGARNEERREEMIEIEKIITFIKVKPIPLVTKDRWLLRRGPLQLLKFDSKMTLSNTLRRLRRYHYKTIYLFLFNDLLVITKKKSETLYTVIDFANRNLIRIQERQPSAKNSFTLVLLENVEGKTKELNVRVETETEMTRWREAFRPPESDVGDEKIYGTWDCPQVNALHDYQAQQSDELSLVLGDVVNVIRKLPDGWYEGERIRDGVSGWFPANHTEEIRNEHVRARNLHQRYRLLAASTAFLDKKKR